MKFTVTVEGEEILRRKFNRVENSIEDLTPIWKEVQQEFFDIEADQFQSGGVVGASGKWQELSPRYEEVKVQKFGTFALLAGTLRATDDLYSSLTGETQHTVAIFDKQEAAFGTDLPYAKSHQKGGKRLPKRPPIDLSDTQKRRVQKRIQKGLLKEVRKADFIMDESNYKDI